MILTSFVLAICLKFSSMSASVLSWTTLIAGLLCSFAGGLIAGAKSMKKGWIIGGLTGLGFSLFTFIVQYLSYNQGFSLEQSLHHLGFVLSALIGVRSEEHTSVLQSRFD